MAQRVLILGGGFGGISVARTLERLGEPFDVTLVSRDNYGLFTPMLPEVSTGGIETRHIVQPIRAELRKTRFVLGEIECVDLERKRVQVHHPLLGVPSQLSYDHLVLALGATAHTFGLPGVEERAVQLKTLDDGIRLRNELIRMFELAEVAAGEDERRRLLCFTVVGGGFTGVEAAGEVQEFVDSVASFYPGLRASWVRVVLLEGGSRLLPELPEAFGVSARAMLQHRGVEVITGDQVACADASGILLKSGRHIDCQLIVWSAGSRPSPQVRDLPVEHARNGAVIANADLSVPGFPGVWVLGDCAQIPKPEGGWYPPTAQHAIREAPLLARNIVASVRGRETKAFSYSSLGMMASLGHRQGVAEILRGRMLTGFPAWFLWRTYYLLQLPGLDRKLRVALDWTLNLIFRRDIARLRISGELSVDREAVRPEEKPLLT
ncbi:NAD(P)/FAD-dependent oxidoreductase [bacterium]|nr:MAG: NAD(P)/FAD-dependent oxidoreductase [bacterium]